MSDSEDFKGFSSTSRTQLSTSTSKADFIYSTAVKGNEDMDNSMKISILEKLIQEAERICSNSSKLNEASGSRLPVLTEIDLVAENSPPKQKDANVNFESPFKLPSIFSPLQSSDDVDINNLDSPVVSRKRKAIRTISTDYDDEDNCRTNNTKVRKLNSSLTKSEVMSINPKSTFDHCTYSQQLKDLYINILEYYSSILEKAPLEVLEMIPDFDPSVFNTFKTLKNFVEYKVTKKKIKTDWIRILKHRKNKKMMSPSVLKEARGEPVEVGVTTKEEPQSILKKGQKRYPNHKTRSSAKRPRADRKE